MTDNNVEKQLRELTKRMRSIWVLVYVAAVAAVFTAALLILEIVIEAKSVGVSLWPFG